MSAYRCLPISPSYVIGAVLLAWLTGCSSSADTVLALNVTIRQSAKSTRELAISVTQAGQQSLETETSLMVPTKTTDAGVVATGDQFVERMTLPAGFSDGDATVQVQAKDQAGTAVAATEIMAQVRAHGAVAVFVTLGSDPAPPAPVGDAGEPEQPEQPDQDAGG